MVVELSSILKNPVAYLGKIISVRGVLVVRGVECYLVRDHDDYDSPIRMTISAPNLAARLLEVVPVWVGGAGIYLDDVEIVGSVSNADGRATLADVESLKLFRDDEIFEIRLV